MPNYTRTTISITEEHAARAKELHSELSAAVRLIIDRYSYLMAATTPKLDKEEAKLFRAALAEYGPEHYRAVVRLLPDLMRVYLDDAGIDRPAIIERCNALTATERMALLDWVTGQR